MAGYGVRYEIQRDTARFVRMDTAGYSVGYRGIQWLVCCKMDRYHIIESRQGDTRDTVRYKAGYVIQVHR